MPHDLLDWYTKGEQDYVEHNGYNQPNNALEIALDTDKRLREQLIAENIAYKDGYESAKEQDD
jgi:hypothetical protein